MRLISLTYLLPLFNTLIISGQTRPLDTSRIYAQKELKADLLFLRKNLEKTHPALYRYTPKSRFKVFFDSLYHAINQPMNEQKFFSLITLLHEKIGDDYTMFLPSEAMTDHNNAKGKFLPLNLTYIDGKLYVAENCSADSSIERGEEVISINGEKTDTVISQLMARQIRDGYNQTYLTWILNHYFAACYQFVYGQPAKFLLELRNLKSTFHKKQITALTRDSIKFFRQSRYPVPADQGINRYFDTFVFNK